MSKNDIKQYLKYLSDKSINYYETEEYVKYLNKNKYAKSSINRKIASINKFYDRYIFKINIFYFSIFSLYFLYPNIK